MKFILWYTTIKASCVAPARERGLKFLDVKFNLKCIRRSREGAWIEILGISPEFVGSSCRSREGAWIEIGL